MVERDRYNAVWVSHSSITDYLKCPRSYFLRNVYKDPRSGHKITVMQPALALGQTVHSVLESLSLLPTGERLSESLIDKYDKAWEGIAGELGGFRTSQEEEEYRARGRAMITRAMQNPGPIARRAIKIKQDLPQFYLSEEDNIILCGKIDWIEYLEDDDSVHIIDFKTGKRDESPNSLQLPIYLLLATNCQKRPVTKASYWYLDRHDNPQEVSLPEAAAAKEEVLGLAKKIKLARKLGAFTCPQDGCAACLPFEKVLRGEGKFIGVGGYNQDTYIIP